MLFSRKLSRSPRPTGTFRPVVVPLEDRTVPSRFAAPGPATHLQVIVPESVQAGQSFDVLVEAEDASNRIATGFTDQVTLSLGTPDAGATLPTAFTFTAGDHGVHEFKVTLAATGSQTIKATDTTANSTVTAGSATTVVNPAPAATTVVVQTPEQAATGVATPVTVEVLDQSGRPLRNFTGTVTFTSSDATATASATRKGTQTALSTFSYTFSASDRGEHTFTFVFGTGSATGTATTVTANVTAGMTSLSGLGSVTVFPPTTVTHFGVFAVPFAFSGFATPVEIVALNAADQVVTGYNGTVSFSSSDSAAKVSATRTGTASPLSSFTYQFTTGTGNDNGKHTFWLTFGTTEKQTLTVTDSATKFTGSADFYVLTALPFPRHGGWAI